MENITSHDEMLEYPKTVDEVVERYVAGLNCLKRDRGDYYELEPTGVLINTDKFLWVQGVENIFECNLEDGGRLHITPPQLVLKFPKKLPANMTLESFTHQVVDEAMDKFSAIMRRELLKWDNARTGMEASITRDQIVDAEAQNMEQEPLTNNLAMEELNSALDNCAKGNCAACGGICVHKKLNCRLLCSINRFIYR